MTDRRHDPLDDIAEKLASGLRLLGGLKQGAEAQVRTLVEETLAQFDVVTRDQMELQEAMLRKAREEMAALDERIRQLEARVHELERHRS
ncbi:MAG: accessory factor UbiK family protein [Zetaproteobacteria bacterium]|nr:MAG: accessory factor UbiK family protein [Zetaproteobacteria bacterium]